MRRSAWVASLAIGLLASIFLAVSLEWGVTAAEMVVNPQFERATEARLRHQADVALLLFCGLEVVAGVVAMLGFRRGDWLRRVGSLLLVGVFSGFSS